MSSSIHAAEEPPHVSLWEQPAQWETYQGKRCRMERQLATKFCTEFESGRGGGHAETPPGRPGAISMWSCRFSYLCFGKAACY